MSCGEFCFKPSDAVDQIAQGGRAVGRVTLGMGELVTEMLLVHRALSDHRVDGIARGHAGKGTASGLARQKRLRRSLSQLRYDKRHADAPLCNRACRNELAVRRFIGCHYPKPAIVRDRCPCSRVHGHGEQGSHSEGQQHSQRQTLG